MTAALEQVLAGETTLAILVFKTWAESSGRESQSLGGIVDAWIAEGRPDSSGIARSLSRLRALMERYRTRGGTVPGWFPISLRKVIGEPGAGGVGEAGKCG